MPNDQPQTTNHRPSALPRLDRAIILIIAILGALTLCWLLVVPKAFLPSGDADILFQFSRNLAHTGSITFIPSGPRAEGATDFAWMVLLSLGIKLGAEPMWLIAFLNVISLVALGVLLLKIAGKRPKPLPILFIAGAFALMPQIFSAAAGFSTLPFGFLLVLLAFCFLQQNDIALPLVAFLLCLFRPDGIVFAVPLLVAAIVHYPNKLRRSLLDALLFVLPGLVYFVWRWHYFGQLFPLPFLVKSNTQRLLHLVVETSLVQGKNLCWFSAIVLFFVLVGRMRIARNRAVLLCFVVLPNFFYFAMRLDQDVALRFFIYLPVGTAILIAMNWEALRPRLSFLLILSLTAWIILLSRTWITQGKLLASLRPAQAKSIAEDLAKFPTGVLITTEAGELPYYSHWASYDAWGLNTPAFAKRLFQPSDVAAIHPDLILVFTNTPGYGLDCTPQNDWHPPYTERTWDNLTRNIITGANSTQYELLLLPVVIPRHPSDDHTFSWQGEQFCMFVRRDSPLHSDIDAVLIRHGGIPMAQYLKLMPPSPTTQLAVSDVTPPKSTSGPLHKIRRLFHLIWLTLPN